MGWEAAWHQTLQKKRKTMLISRGFICVYLSQFCCSIGIIAEKVILPHR